MKRKTKVRILWYVSFFVSFFIVWTILQVTFKNLADGYKGMISAVIASLLSPKITEFETQSGKKLQLKWVFMKKIVTI